MNPWNGADETAEGGDEPLEAAASEAQERELFAGRRRAMARAEIGLEVPSLEAVLREAPRPKVARIERRAGAREAIAVAVAAACLMATFTRLPSAAPTAIGPDIDAAAPRLAATLMEHAAAETCEGATEMAETCAPPEDVCSSASGPASVPPSMSMVTPAAATGPDPTEACGSEMPTPPPFTPANESHAGTCP